MNPDLLWRLIPQLLPMLPDIEKALTTAQSSEVRAMLATFQKVAQVVEGAEKAAGGA